MGGFAPPAAMYGYPPMYGMDPYMMGGYYGGFKNNYFKPKTFKNKTLILKKGEPVIEEQPVARPKSFTYKKGDELKGSNASEKTNAAPSSSIK